MSRNIHLQSLPGSPQLPMQKDSRGERNKETEAMCRICFTRDWRPAPWIGAAFARGPSGHPCSPLPISSSRCWGFATLRACERLLLCSRANFVQNMKLTLWSFHAGNWYSCMSLNKPVIMSLLHRTHGMPGSSLCLHPPKMHRNYTRDWQQDRKEGFAHWYTICHQKTRETPRISVLQSFVNSMLLLQFRLVQITLNKACIWLNYSSQSLLEKWFLCEEVMAVLTTLSWTKYSLIFLNSLLLEPGH